jgi:hypothetical protein
MGLQRRSQEGPGSPKTTEREAGGWEWPAPGSRVVRANASRRWSACASRLYEDAFPGAFLG